MAPTTKRGGLPYVYVTWITKVLSGEDSCAYAPWFKAHFKFTKVDRGFDLAAWKASHADMVAVRRRELEGLGYATITVEDQNDFKWKGQTALLSGKCDLVAIRQVQYPHAGEVDSETRTEVLIVDCKGGQQRDSDWWQVLIYLLALPKVWGDRIPAGASWRGEVRYTDHCVAIEPEELNDERRQRIFATLRQMGGDERPVKVPSRRECAWCDLSTRDCPERVEQAEPVTALAGEF